MMKLSNVRDNFYLADNDFVNNNEILTDKSKLRMQKSKADNTLKSYAADWNDFADWCELKKVSPLPCLPETIVNYINDLADDAKANTVARRITAISENHIAAGYSSTNPAKDGLVRNAMRAIRREKGTFQKGKAPILMETIELLTPFDDRVFIVPMRCIRCFSPHMILKSMRASGNSRHTDLRLHDCLANQPRFNRRLLRSLL